MAVVGLLAVAARAGYLGVVARGDLSALAADQRTRVVNLDAPRGTIYDRNGQELAADRPTARVEATPRIVVDPVATARRLAPLLGRPEAEIAEKLSSGTTNVLLRRQVSYSVARRIRALQITGIDLFDTTTRVLPQGMVGAQAVGLVDEKGDGQGGVERQFNDVLSGTAGRRVEARDPLGDTLEVTSRVEPRPGRDVHTTIDVAIQKHTEEVLEQAMRTHKAKSASAVVMNPTTGEILAIASLPRFNPNDRSDYSAEVDTNRPVSFVFEPGSTFKVVTFAAALEAGAVTPATPIFVPEFLWIDRDLDRRLYDAERDRPAQTMRVEQIVQHSSNVGTVLVAQKLGARTVNDWISRFGFGERTGLGLPGEEQGKVLPTEQWSGASIYNIPIGQGNLVTQMQIVRAYAAIANGGNLVNPRLVSRVGADPVAEGRTTRVISEATARNVDMMLRGVVTSDGTGAEASIPGYQVAGKTGTANKVDPATGEYSSNVHTASFVGYVPADRPQVVISVVVDEPTAGEYTGGAVAAPAFEKIGQFCLSRLEIPSE